MLFDLLGSLLSAPRVDAAIHWTSRWASDAWPALDDDMPGAVTDTFWPDLAPTALGTALELLGRSLPRGGELLTATSSQLVRLWAVRTPQVQPLHATHSSRVDMSLVQPDARRTGQRMSSVGLQRALRRGAAERDVRAARAPVCCAHADFRRQA